jgi:hypothetical protein
MKSLILLAIFSVGCATSYQPDSYSGGYGETKLNDDIYRVYFRGNGYTSSERVNRFFMKRCAELTVQSGYEYFALINNENGTSTELLSNAYGSGNYSTVSKSKSAGMIKMFKTGSQPSISFNAQQILDNNKD